jgi:hypothetical protein
MFLRRPNRKKDGKDHHYFSIVENHRLASGRTVRRTVLYLGEINDAVYREAEIAVARPAATAPHCANRE